MEDFRGYLSAVDVRKFECDSTLFEGITGHYGIVPLPRNQPLHPLVPSLIEQWLIDTDEPMARLSGTMLPRLLTELEVVPGYRKALEALTEDEWPRAKLFVSIVELLAYSCVFKVMVYVAPSDDDKEEGQKDAVRDVRFVQTFTFWLAFQYAFTTREDPSIPRIVHTRTRRSKTARSLAF